MSRDNHCRATDLICNGKKARASVNKHKYFTREPLEKAERRQAHLMRLAELNEPQMVLEEE